MQGPGWLRPQSCGPVCQVFIKQHPAMAPEDLGTIGYAGEEALYVTKARAAANLAWGSRVLEFWADSSVSSCKQRRRQNRRRTTFEALGRGSVGPCKILSDLQSQSGELKTRCTWGSRQAWLSGTMGSDKWYKYPRYRYSCSFLTPKTGTPL